MSGIETYSSQIGKVAIVTGTGGLGFETARVLVGLGATVIIAGRGAQKGRDAVDAIMSETPSGLVRFELLDLADLTSVRDFAVRMLHDVQGIDLLVNNAGIMSPPKRRTTIDGFEAQFGVNHLGHFALTGRLLPLLAKSNAAKVVHITSLAHHYGKLDFTDLQSERGYKAGVAYCCSKLATALFARSLQIRSDEEGWSISSMAAHPGYAGTNLIAAEQGADSVFSRISRRLIVPLIGQSASDGARAQLFAALSPDAIGGRLYGPTGFLQMKGRPGECSFGKSALDDTAADTLWHFSEELTGVRFA